MQSGLERGFRYFKVSPIKAFRDIRHVSVDKVFATGRFSERIMMRRMRMILQYDGTAYKGWQVQKTGTTIQGLLQDVISRLTGERVQVIGAGRTDAGVHALAQVASFDTSSRLEPPALQRGLNALLPADIRVTGLDEVASEFHPRKSACRKRYMYLIANMEEIPVFMERYMWGIRFPLDTAKMNAAAGYLMGRHDFSSFRGAKCGSRNTERTIYSIGLEKKEEVMFLFVGFKGTFIRLSIEADGFLRHMVRNIIGTLVEVGREKADPQKIIEILASRDRRVAGPMAPARGLFLERVFYAPSL
jgi:tRNA pseudouridine38-40 synthase